MPWKDTSPMAQRTQLIADYLRDTLAVTELCQLYGVSRKTAYKWIDRYLRQGPAGLDERSRRPRHSPNETAPAIVAAFLDARSCPHNHVSRRLGWNNSTGLPDGSSRMTCAPPGPETMSLVRKGTPAARSRATSAARSLTSRCKRFQPPGV